MNSNLFCLVFDVRRGMQVAVAESVSAPRRAGTGRGARRAGRARAALGVFMLTAAAAAVAQVLPGGANVVHGVGSVNVQGSAMVVRQDTARMVTDWQSFSIGTGASVQFVQPSSQAVALNRVVGADPSAILGRLTANGHVYLQNPNGVLFAPGAQVDVGSLVATTLNANLTAFMAGRLDLSAGDAPAGSVVNEGELRAAPGGHVLLAGPQVANHGRIEAPGGTIGMAAGNAVAVDATGAGLLDIQVPVAAIGAMLSHSGQAVADGGRVSLQVAAADAARRTVMQVDGLVRAQHIENRGGQIVLSGGDSGVVKVYGTLDASAPAGVGGAISVLGERVGLLGAATLDASGAAGGGQLLVGGNFQGRGPEMNAELTVVGPDVRLDVSATQHGDGGRVIVWADGHTRYEGQIYATGGAQGGDGGFAEVSGKQTLDFRGTADLRAAQGQKGLLLLDPDVIFIDDVADMDGNGELGDDLIDNLAFGDFPGAISEITAARVSSLLFTADVTLQATSIIYVFSPIEVAPEGALSTLTLEAAIIEILEPMTLNNSSLVIASTSPGSDSVVLAADVQSLRSVSISATSIELSSGTLVADSVVLLDNSNGLGSVLQCAVCHVIDTNSLVVGESGASFLSADLLGSSNQIRAASFSVVGEAYLTTANVDYAIDVSGSAGALYLDAVSGITQSAPLTTGFLALIATDPGATGAVVLTNPGNAIEGIGFEVAGSIDVFTSGSLFNDADYATDAGGDVRLRALETFTLNNAVSSLTSIEVDSAGFINQAEASLVAPRFTIRSSDYTVDSFNVISFGEGADQINAVVYNGYSGVAPADNLNVLYTNQDGRLTFNVSDLPDVSRVYDGTTVLTVGYGLAPTSANAFAVTSDGDVPLLGLTLYGVNLVGNFDDANAGTNKGFTLASSTDTFARGGFVPGLSVQYYGLRTDPVVRTPGPSETIPVSEVTPLAVTVAGVAAANKVYDTSTAAGLIGAPTVATILGDDVTVGGIVLAEFADKNVGTNKPVTVGGYTLAGPDAPNYTLIQPSGLTADISPALLLLNGLSALDKVYDATTTAGIVGLAAVTPLAGDLVTLSGIGVAAFADKNAGAEKPVTVGGYTLGGPDGDNYTLVSPAGLTANITPLAVAVAGVTAANKVYDASTAAGLIGVPTVATILGDDVTVGGIVLAEFGDKNVGTDKSVTVGGYSLGGADALNYSLIQPSGLMADISPLAVAVAGVAAANKVYDTSTAAGLIGVPTVATILGDDVTVGGIVLAEFADKNVGTNKPVTVGGYTLAGPDAPNYTLIQPSGLTADISPALLLLNGLSALDKVYDATTTAGIVGLAAVTPLAGDLVTLSGIGVAAFADKNVGTDKSVTVGGYTLVGADALNYSLIQPLGLTADITQALLFVEGLSALDKIYDATLNATLAGTGTVSPIGGDAVSLSGSPIGTFSGKNVGIDIPVAVAGLTLVGPDAGNYQLIAGSGLAADISPRQLVPSGIVATDRRADGSLNVAIDTSAAALTGVLPGDSVALLIDDARGVVDSADPGVDKPVTILGLTLDGADASNYLLSAAPGAGGTTVTFLPLRTPLEELFEELRFDEYLQGVSDAQEPFRRAMAEALAAGFGKENIRKQLSAGLVFETGLAAPAIENIQPAGQPPQCDAGGAAGALTCR